MIPTYQYSIAGRMQLLERTSFFPLMFMSTCTTPIPHVHVDSLNAVMSLVSIWRMIECFHVPTLSSINASTKHFCPNLGLLHALASSLRRYTSTQLTLHKAPQHLTPRLQQRMPDHDLQEALQPLPSMLDHIVREAVREHLAGKRRDGHARGLPLEDVSEVLEVAVAAADHAVAQFKGGNVGPGVDLVGGIHRAGGGAVGLWVFDLKGVLVGW